MRYKMISKGKYTVNIYIYICIPTEIFYCKCFVSLIAYFCLIDSDIILYICVKVLNAIVIFVFRQQTNYRKFKIVLLVYCRYVYKGKWKWKCNFVFRFMNSERPLFCSTNPSVPAYKNNHTQIYSVLNNGNVNNNIQLDKICTQVFIEQTKKDLTYTNPHSLRQIINYMLK